MINAVLIPPALDEPLERIRVFARTHLTLKGV
jgi:hypothetical protein